MQKPATLIDAVDVVRKSRLVSEAQLSEVLDGVRADWPLDPPPAELFHDLVRQGLLTAFQATQLGCGRWKGFGIGSYRILDRLGSGGMGQVFLAEHETLGRRVALKVLSRRTASPLALERFVREARSAAKLDHPNIIRVHDIDVNHDPPFIVMEYADGVTLQAAVARGGTLHPGVAAGLLQQVAHGLEAAYRNGLVHRDVKPANIIVDRRGVARILDLGIVRIEGENITSEYATNVILGTIDYLAPEQAVDSSNVDTRADIYSLGATLYFLLTATTPVPAGPIRERLAALQSASPPDLRLLRPDVPEGLGQVLQTMMAKSAADRYQTPQEAADALAPFASASPGLPALLFRHSNSATVSDTAGSATPPGGIPVAPTEITVLEWTKDSSGVFSADFACAEADGLTREIAKAEAPRWGSVMLRSFVPPICRESVWLAIWALAGFLVIFALFGIAFYIWK